MLADLALSGMGNYTVTGIDALFSYQQPVITENVGGNLVIRDLYVKDYPLILRLNAPRHIFLPLVLSGNPP